jgi:DNA mismatch endonuclease, patch repair protein
MDTVSPATRRRMMQAVKGRDTSPELRLRAALHRRGLRFRVCHKTLPGTPDVVFPRQKLAIFVHGCYWHRHSGCPKATTPKTNVEFWAEKFLANVARDQKKRQVLEDMGWTVKEIWECEVGSADRADRVVDTLFPK